MSGGVGSSPIPHGEAGPGFPNTPEYRARMEQAAQNLGIPGTDEASADPSRTDSEFLGELRREVMDAAQRFEDQGPNIDQTIRDLREKGEADPYRRIEEE